jgi:Zn-dependent M28 family amino/carboxypeptidase
MVFEITSNFFYYNEEETAQLTHTWTKYISEVETNDFIQTLADANQKLPVTSEMSQPEEWWTNMQPIKSGSDSVHVRLAEGKKKSFSKQQYTYLKTLTW